MKTKLFIMILSLFVVLSMIFISCKTETTSTTTSATPTTSTSASTTLKTTTTAPTNTGVTTTANITTTVSPGKWWDKYGVPKYGGSITFMNGVVDSIWDPGQFMGAWGLQWESLFNRDWTTDPEVWAYPTEFSPIDCYKGGLAESWEMTSPTTVLIHLHEGITWQNASPLNGRELTADDVQYTFDRILGTGSGFTSPNFMMASFVPTVKQVAAKDKYTVEFSLVSQSSFAIWDVLNGGWTCIPIVAHELVEQDLLKDWKTAVGSGPWAVSDFVQNSYAKYTKNGSYWNFDERHPENRLPYADELTKIVIADTSTALAALRTGKIDIQFSTGSFPINDAQIDAVRKTNPELEVHYNAYPNIALQMRIDKAPFDDIRVRKALQMCLDLSAIAKAVSNGALSGDPCGLINSAQKDFSTPFKDWPADLQKEYSYNVGEARKLMTEAGYANGFQTNVVSAVSNRDMLLIFKSYFSQIGVDMEINAINDPNSMRLLLRAGKQDAFAATQSVAGVRSPASLVQQLVSTYQDNYTKSSDPQYDELVKKILSEPDLKTTQDLIKQADLFQLAQHWQIATFSNRMPILWQPYLKGYSGEFVVTGLESFYFSRVWLDKDTR